MKVYDTNFIKDQFPALQRKVWDKKLVYLDSAHLCKNLKEY